MRPPLELNRLTVLNIVAIVCYCLSIMFHIIAYATHSWASLVLNGVRWEMGLWQGCRQTDDGGWNCTADVFQDDVFQNGSDWHTGSQIMMTLALVILFFLEFVLLGYLCIHRLQKYKSKLLGFVVGLSVSAGILTLATIMLCGIRALEAPNGSLEWSFGMLLLTLSFEILCLCIVIFNSYKNRLLGKSMKRTRDVYGTIDTNSVDDNLYSYVNQTFTVVDLNLDDAAF